MRASTVAALLVLCVSRWAASTVAELADVTAGTFDGRELLQKATTTQKPRPTANAGTKAPTKQQKPVKQAGRNLLSDDDMQIEGRALLQAKQDTKKSTGNKKPSADTKKETGAKKGPSTQAVPGRHLLGGGTTQNVRPSASAAVKASIKQQTVVKQAGRNLLDDGMGRELLQAKQDTKKSTGNKKPSADTKKETGAKKGPSTQAAPGRHLLQTPQVAAPQPRQQGANNNFNPQRKAKVTAGRRLLSGSDKKPKQPKGATTKKPSSKTTQATKRP